MNQLRFHREDGTELLINQAEFHTPRSIDYLKKTLETEGLCDSSRTELSLRLKELARLYKVDL